MQDAFRNAPLARLRLAAISQIWLYPTNWVPINAVQALGARAFEGISGFRVLTFVVMQGSLYGLTSLLCAIYRGCVTLCK